MVGRRNGRLAIAMVNSKYFRPDPSAPLSLWAQMARIGFESQIVIGLRVAGMMGLAAHAPEENVRMVTEKLDAAHESMHASFSAAVRGETADKVMTAALRPYSKRTRANSRRLSHRG